MKALLKIILLIMAAGCFVALTGFIWISRMDIQIVVMLTVLVLSLLRFGFSRFWQEFKLVLPFILFMLAVYAILGLAGMRLENLPSSGQSDLSVTLKYGLLRSLLFISTMFFFQFCLSYLDIADVLGLPFSIHYKKTLILGRALFTNTMSQLEEVEMHLRLIPEYQTGRLTWKQWFRFKLQLTLSVLVMILREARIKGELIDNRILHCFDDPGSSHI